LARDAPVTGMRLEFHPAVQNDFNSAVDYYEAEGGPNLADRFKEEVRHCLAAITAGPTHFSFYNRSDRFRRIRLKSFPYVIVYRESAAVVRVSVLKHERRHPRFGIGRR
jgi:plasmid stabilization system protein ParE